MYYFKLLVNYFNTISNNNKINNFFLINFIMVKIQEKIRQLVVNKMLSGSKQVKVAEELNLGQITGISMCLGVSSGRQP